MKHKHLILAVVVLMAATLIGVNATTQAVDEADVHSSSATTARQWMGLGTVHSVAEAERLARQAGLSGRTLKVTTHENDWQAVDTGPKGDSLGDYFWSTGTLYNASHTRAIGEQYLRCEFTSWGAKSRISAWCEQPLHFTGRGKILLSNPIFGQSDVASVIGGTKKFKSVGGQAKLTLLDNGHTFDLLFIIDLDHP
jgi:hypothetical protein